MTNTIKVCGSFYGARVFIVKSRPDEIGEAGPLGASNWSVIRPLEEHHSRTAVLLPEGSIFKRES